MRLTDGVAAHVEQHRPAGAERLELLVACRPRCRARPTRPSRAAPPRASGASGRAARRRVERLAPEPGRDRSRWEPTPSFSGATPSRSGTRRTASGREHEQPLAARAPSAASGSAHSSRVVPARPAGPSSISRSISSSVPCRWPIRGTSRKVALGGLVDRREVVQVEQVGLPRAGGRELPAPGVHLVLVGARRRAGRTRGPARPGGPRRRGGRAGRRPSGRARPRPCRSRARARRGPGRRWRRSRAPRVDRASRRRASGPSPTPAASAPGSAPPGSSRRAGRTSAP